MSDAARRQRFETLAREHADDLFRFAVWLCHDRSRADDLVQETFERAWKAIDSLADTGAAKSWLITILRREHARGFERKQLPMTEVDSPDVIAGESAAPDAELEDDLMRRALAGLDEKYREPLVMQALFGHSIREIAETLGLSETAVMTRVFRAREKLRQRLGGNDRSDNVHELG